ncbi:MAG: sigma-70 family RNA polymerase sigma factor [Planctomycetota bacterium]|nr:sigma-70 family RNA polymerase sigma factor [Planctomycetota bacterium]
MSDPVEHPSDESLFQRYREGDLGAFRALVERYHDDLLRFLTRLLGDRQAAEDVFQETFVQVHQSAQTFDAERRFRPWLFTIAANKGRDYLRKKGRRQAFDLSAPVASAGDEGGMTYVDLLEVDFPAPSAAIDDRELGQQVQRVLDAMPYSLREILLLAYFQRLSYAQISDELNVPLGTVKSRLHSAVAAFAKRWKASHGSEDGTGIEQGAETS